MKILLDYIISYLVKMNICETINVYWWIMMNNCLLGVIFMSSTVNKNIITVTKGDSFWATISIDGYEPDPNDEIRFALKSSLDDEEQPIILKTIPTDTMELRLDSADTKQLNVGSYYYDVQITLAGNGFVDTFIEAREGKPNFKVTPEVE